MAGGFFALCVFVSSVQAENINIFGGIHITNGILCWLFDEFTQVPQLECQTITQ